MDQQKEKRLLLADTLTVPAFAGELRQLLTELGGVQLAAQVPRLMDFRPVPLLG